MLHRERQAGEHRNAVVCLLTHRVRLVAEPMIGEGREGGRLALDLLQHQDIRLAPFEPACDVLLPLADRVDVPGGDLHVPAVVASRLRCSAASAVRHSSALYFRDGAAK